MIRTSYE